MEKKVLIVEDTATIHMMYRLKFQKAGYEVEVAENGFEAVMKLQTFVPDVILLDIMMPDMDGVETLKIIKDELKTDCRILVISNVSDQVIIKQVESQGIDGYFIKADITPDELLKEVEKLLD